MPADLARMPHPPSAILQAALAVRWLPAILAACSVVAALPLATPAQASALPLSHAMAASSALATAPPAPLTPQQTQELVQRVLRTEIDAIQDTSHPMQYRLRKTSPRLSTTKQIVETKDGDVARLLAVNNTPLSPEDSQTEAARLEKLLNDPNLQRHRQEREQGDADRIRKIIRALPNAFLYSYAGIADTPSGPSYRLSFQPNPAFDPQYLEAQVLKAMAGELWIDVAQQRVTKLDCKRLHDVDVGWGLLGRLDQGGTLLLEQADVGNRQWRTTRMVMAMNARVFFESKNWDTTLEMTQFAPVPAGITYQQAIHLLQTNPVDSSQPK
jgi:hypothetical protein